MMLISAETRNGMEVTGKSLYILLIPHARTGKSPNS